MTLGQLGLASTLGGLALATSASAAVVVPTTGTTDYYIEFANDGDEDLDDIYDVGLTTFLGTDAFEVTLTAASQLIFSVNDAFNFGDIFGLEIDGVDTAFTSTVPADVATYFEGTYAATLAAGTYLFSLDITSAAGGLPAGAYASFDISPATVPVPAAAPLLIAAIGGLGFAAKRRRKAA